MRCLPLCLALVALGCGSDESSPREPVSPVTEGQGPAEAPDTTAATDREVRDGFFVTDDAPEPTGCAADTDCMGDTIPDVSNPCCQNPRTLRAYSRAYRSWIGAWRTEHCEGVQCPPPPPPSPPPRCRFEVRCVDGTCADSCP